MPKTALKRAHTHEVTRAHTRHVLTVRADHWLLGGCPASCAAPTRVAAVGYGSQRGKTL